MVLQWSPPCSVYEVELQKKNGKRHELVCLSTCGRQRLEQISPVRAGDRPTARTGVGSADSRVTPHTRWREAPARRRGWLATGPRLSHRTRPVGAPREAAAVRLITQGQAGCETQRRAPAWDSTCTVPYTGRGCRRQESWTQSDLSGRLGHLQWAFQSFPSSQWRRSFVEAAIFCTPSGGATFTARNRRPARRPPHPLGRPPTGPPATGQPPRATAQGHQARTRAAAVTVQYVVVVMVVVVVVRPDERPARRTSAGRAAAALLGGCRISQRPAARRAWVLGARCLHKPRVTFRPARPVLLLLLPGPASPHAPPADDRSRRGRRRSIRGPAVCVAPPPKTHALARSRPHRRTGRIEPRRGGGDDDDDWMHWPFTSIGRDFADLRCNTLPNGARS